MAFDLFKGIGFGGENQSKTTDAFRSLGFKDAPNMSTTSGPKFAPAPSQSYQTLSPKNQPVEKSYTKTYTAPTKAVTPTAPAVDINEVMAYLNKRNTPGSVNVDIGSNINANSMNTTPSPTSLEEKRKKAERNVLTSKFAKEEEELLGKVTNLREYVGKLQGIQAKEFNALEQNPMGQLAPGLNADLGRLSENQALELNARTSQLNAYLDTLELYQGYKPQIMGAPQIDEATGMGYVFVQDPTTGAISTESLGQITTPISQTPEGFTLGKDQVRYEYNQQTGQMEPVGYGYSGGGGSGVAGALGSGVFGDNRVNTSGLDFDNPDDIASLPISDISKAILSGSGSIKDLTPTQKADVLAEMYNVGFNPQQYVVSKLEGLLGLWNQIPQGQKGLLQGALNPATYFSPAVKEFESSRNVITRIVARLNDVGMLSDQDVKDYKDAMPSKYDNNPAVASAKIRGLAQAITGKTQQVGGTPVGTEAQLDDGTFVTKTTKGWVDSYSGQPVNVEE